MNILTLEIKSKTPNTEGFMNLIVGGLFNGKLIKLFRFNYEIGLSALFKKSSLFYLFNFIQPELWKIFFLDFVSAPCNFKRKVFNSLLAVAIRSNKIDVVYFPFVSNTRYISIGLVKTLCDVSFVVSARGSDVYVGDVSRSLEFLELIKEQNFTIHFVSNAIRNYFEQNISKTFNGFVKFDSCDTKLFVNLVEQNLNHDFSNDNTFISVTRDSLAKSNLEMVKIIYMLNLKGLVGKWIVVGDLGHDHKNFSKALKFFGLNEKVVFTGSLTQEDVAKYFSLSHCFLNYSLFEGYCVSVIEARVSGLLVFASGTGGILDNISDGVNGVLLNPFSVEHSVSVIAETLKNNNVCREIIKNNLS